MKSLTLQAQLCFILCISHLVRYSICSSILQNKNSTLQSVNITSLQGINIYSIGNSVMRHYSFSFLGYLDGLHHDSSLNRTEEKSSCHGVVGTSSCDHYSVNSETFIRFLWKQYIGNGTCDDLRRDFCYGIDDDSSERCLKFTMPPTIEEAKGAAHNGAYLPKPLKIASSKDILLISSIPMKTELWCSNKFQCGLRCDISIQTKHILHGHKFFFKDGSMFGNDTASLQHNPQKLFTREIATWAGKDV